MHQTSEAKRNEQAAEHRTKYIKTTWKHASSFTLTTTSPRSSGRI